ncbi:hypothetical protein [Bacillus sp. Au-Bac7]|uniref:hypothetical protein n=1 Tax=Bacillus sp. Au-Bac7 TaxID=2906458 RepID=UPI001E471992|nr:hypothetical protein [Bacillus sp. Au-Bac7]MCE4052032.1 hypothetical protein [Bacillus sp. Au-Bac7]
MAILANYTLPAGTELASFQNDNRIQSYISTEDYQVTNGYVKINSLRGDKELLTITVSFQKDANGPVLMNKDYSFVPDVSTNGDNFYAQGYAHIKSLAEFANAIDVIE